MENCCDPSKIENGEINNSIINNPTINTPAINGTIVLDEAALNSLVQQMCPGLADCVEEHVNSGSFTGVSLTNSNIADSGLTRPTISGAVTLNSEASASIAQQLCPKLEGCVKEHVDGKTFSGVTLGGSSIVDSAIVRPNITGPLSLDSEAGEDVFGAIEQQVEALVDGKIGTIDIDSLGGIASVSGSGANTSLTNPTLGGTITLTGEIVANQAAKDSLCGVLTPCIENAAADVVDSALPGLLATLPPSSVVKSFAVDEVQKALVLKTDLQSSGTATEQIWQVSLEDLVSRGISVATDGDTILGNGTVGDPIRVNIQTQVVPDPTTNVEIPTSIIGERTMLLGKPSQMLRLGDWLIPLYAA